MFTFINGTLQIAFLYAIPALAIMIAFRIIGFPDLTPDGSFTLGASVAGVLLLSGHSSSYALMVACISGIVAGIITTLLHSKLGISKLLSGILVMLMLYSVSLRIMGTSNLSLMKADTFLGSLTSQLDGSVPIIVTAFLCFLVGLFVYLLLCTNIGLQLRSTGDSDTALECIGVHREGLYMLGLAITNGLTALSGAIISQYQGFTDASMGSGLVIISLSAIIMGETIVKPERVITLIIAPVIGMIIYQSIVASALRIGLPAADLKIATACLALIFIAMDRFRGRHGRIGRQIGNHNF